MSDLFKEHLVKKETTPMDTLKRGLLIGGTAVLALGGLLVYPPLLIGAFGLGIATYFLLPGTDLEYEYLLVNHSLDVDKIMGKQRRKRVKSFDLAQAEVIAPLDSHRMDYYNANTSLKTLDYSSGNPKHKRFAFVVRDGEAPAKVIFEPDEEMIQAIHQSMPGKCFLS